MAAAIFHFILPLRRFYAIIHLKVGDEVKSFKQMQLDDINKNYKEHRGTLIKKHRGVFGKFVFVIDENGNESKVYVGKCIYEDAKIGSTLTIGEINRKLINI